jgi:hypothetical protein
VTPPSAEFDRRPVARLRLRKAAVNLLPERAPVFHVFEELYARAFTETAGASTRREPA